MALYMFQGAYTPEAWATMTKNPQDRSVVLAELIQKLGVGKSASTTVLGNTMSS